MEIQHKIGRTEDMGAVCVIPEIGGFVIRVRRIGDALPKPQLEVALQEVKIIMGIKSEVLPQNRVPHILIDKRGTVVRVVIIRFPGIGPIGLFVITQDKTMGMCSDQMRNIRIMEQYRPIKGAKVKGRLTKTPLLLGITREPQTADQ